MSKQVKAWRCEQCGNTYLNKELADNCCDKKLTKKCWVCGKEIKAYRTMCQECYREKLYKEAKKVKYSEYKGEYLWDDVKEEYFSDKVSLRDRYYDDSYDNGKDPVYPEWCFGSIMIPFKVDIDTALSNATEDMYDEFDMERELIDLDELYKFVNAWNEKQSARAYSFDYDIVVLLNE